MHPVDTERDLLLGTAVCTVARAIRKQHDFADIKPAIQVLEHFLSKGLADAADIVLIQKPEDLRVFRMKSLEKESPNPDPMQEEVNQSVQKFAVSVLKWIQYPDCAPAVGRFLPVFFKSLEDSQRSDALQARVDGLVPLWIFPVKQALERNQELSDVFEIHVLPGLLRLGSADVNAFLKTLPFENIQRGNIGSISIPDIQLCLLVAKIAEDSGPSTFFGQGQSTSPDLENLGVSLLEHPSSNVRIAALSLLVPSSASAGPFCRQVLRRLRQCVPYFHVEVNAKPRNEFIALIKKLCMRLRGATISILRCGKNLDASTTMKTSNIAPSVAGSDGKEPVSTGDVTVQALDEQSQILKEHLAFRKWYMVFLIQELRPTASYQSHITALKILPFLMDQPIALRNISPKIHNEYFGALNEHLPTDLFLRPLTELLLDPFDDVRQSANTVFELYLSTTSIPPRSIPGGGTDNKADSVDQEAKNQADSEVDSHKANCSILVDLEKAEKLAGITGRADHADGFGRLSNLLYTTTGALVKPASWHQRRHLIVDRVIATLEKEVDIAKDDLLLAVGSRPLHGHLIALR